MQCNDPGKLKPVVLTVQQVEQQRTLGEMYRHLRYELIMTELDVAITFCEIAATTDDELRRQGNKVNAATAYTAAIKYMRRSGLTVDMLLKIREKARELQSVWPQSSSGALLSVQTVPVERPHQNPPVVEGAMAGQ